MGALSAVLWLLAMLPQQPCEPATLSGFATLEGTWNVAASDRGPDGSFERTVGVATIEVDRSACSVAVRYTGERQGVSYETADIVRPAPGDVLELARVDSEHGDTTVSVGRLEGSQAVFEWARDLGERVMRTRTTFVLESPTRFRVERALSRATGSEWEPTYSASFTRAPVGGEEGSRTALLVAVIGIFLREDVSDAEFAERIRRHPDIENLLLGCC